MKIIIFVTLILFGSVIVKYWVRNTSQIIPDLYTFAVQDSMAFSCATIHLDDFDTSAPEYCKSCPKCLDEFGDTTDPNLTNFGDINDSDFEYTIQVPIDVEISKPKVTCFMHRCGSKNPCPCPRFVLIWLNWNYQQLVNSIMTTTRPHPSRVPEEDEEDRYFVAGKLYITQGRMYLSTLATFQNVSSYDELMNIYRTIDYNSLFKYTHFRVDYDIRITKDDGIQVSCDKYNPMCFTSVKKLFQEDARWHSDLFSVHKTRVIAGCRQPTEVFVSLMETFMHTSQTFEEMKMSLYNFDEARRRMCLCQKPGDVGSYSDEESEWCREVKWFEKWENYSQRCYDDIFLLPDEDIN